MIGGRVFSPQTKLKWHLGQVGPKNLVHIIKEELFPFFETIKLSGSYLAKCYLSFVWSSEKPASALSEINLLDLIINIHLLTEIGRRMSTSTARPVRRKTPRWSAAGSRSAAASRSRHKTSAANRVRYLSTAQTTTFCVACCVLRGQAKYLKRRTHA